MADTQDPSAVIDPAEEAYAPIRMPSYLVAADNHNLASGSDSWTDYVKGAIGGVAGLAGGAALGAEFGSVAGPLGTIGGALAGGIGGAIIGGKTVASDGKFLAASAISGALSFYNTGVQLNNWVGGDAEKVDPNDLMTSYDSDLGQYYQQNKASVDLTGFFAGSLIPMTGATKIYNFGAAMLNAARAGKIGANFSEATGLLIPAQQRFLSQAVTELSGSSVFSLNNANVLKAFATGVAEEAMQGAIQSTAVLATMHASPILENQDAEDMAWNILGGAIFQGAIGGVVQAAKGYGFIRRGVQAAEMEAKPQMFIGELRDDANAPPVHKILNWLDEKLATPEVEADSANQAFQIRQQQAKFRAIDDRVRSGFTTISRNDDPVGLGLSDLAATWNNIRDAASNLVGLKEASRVANPMNVEKAVAAAQRRMGMGQGTPEDMNLLFYTDVRYMQLHGEGAGTLSDTPPATVGLADSLKPGEEIKISANSVQAGTKNRFNFSTNPKNQWDALGQTQENIEARYMWAMHPDGAKLPPGSTVHYTDLPLLDKAGREGIPINVRLSDGSSIPVTTREDLTQIRLQAKSDMRQRFVTASQDNQFVSDPLIVEQKLKQMLGVHFRLEDSPDAIAWTLKGGSDAMSKIGLSPSAIRTGNYTLARLAQAIKHEEGHNIWNLITDPKLGIPGFTATRISDPRILEEMQGISKRVRPDIWKSQDPGMIAYRNDVHELAADTFSYASMNPTKIAKEAPEFNKALGTFVRPVNKEMLDALQIKAQKLSNPELAKVLNVKNGYLEQTAVNTANPAHDLDAIYADAKEHTDRMIAAERWTSPDLIPSYMQPSVAKLAIDTTPVADLNGNVLEGMAVVKQQQRMFQTTANNAVASVTGPELYGQMPTIAEREMSYALRTGPGQGLYKTANEGYGTIGSIMQQLGSVTNKLKKAFTDMTTTEMNSALYGLKTDAAASVEWSALQAKLRATPETYYYDEANQALVLRRIKVNEERVAAGQKPQLADVLDPNAPETIPIENGKTHDAFVAHVARNGDRVSSHNTLTAANGNIPKLDPRAVYPIPVNPKRYPFFSFVVDPTVNETGHVHMIYAATEKDLDNLIGDVHKNTNFTAITDDSGQAIKNTSLKTLTKSEVERFHKAMGDYSRDDTITENYLRTELLRKGVSSNFFPATDPAKVSDDLLDFHLEKDRQLARYAVVTKYSKEFNELKTQGEAATNLATSKVGTSSLNKWAESQVSNPYADYMKTALDITNLNEIPRWTAVNNYLDQKFSQVWDTVSSLWVGSKSPADLEMINKTFQQVGIKTSYQDAATVAHANHVASDGTFTKFVSRANAVMATLLLRMDPLNAYNNVVGSTILTSSELANVMRGIKAGDPAMGALAKIRVPGTDQDIFSPTKLYASSISRFFNNPEARQWAVSNGFTRRHIMEVDALIDQAAMTGKETDAELISKGDKLYSQFMRMGDIAEKFTGNKLAEEFNRFVSADMMRQITDVAVKQGVLTNENAFSYINTFVNRTQGNYLASQRPLMFQGPVGNAIGLFQTYQFNLAQQLLRHVAEGNTKDAALALGLQATIYGMNGLPGWQQINAHLIGNASGNQNHRDLYDATYGAAGKEAGNWLMYGVASNLPGFLHPDLKMNLYTRGDINPRQPTIIPTSPTEVPIVGGFIKMIQSFAGGFQKVANGGDAWPAMMQAIEHAGINRPLAGLAQTLEALGDPKHQSYSTSNKGNVVAANDLFSLANFTRITGGKPFDEALAVDAGYRLDAYKSADVSRRERLGEAIKTTVMGGSTPTPQQIGDFATQYARAGGRQEGFNQFFVGVMKKANTSQVNSIVENLKSPYSNSMQQILGGYELNDFNR